jgi:hypothetical protein
MRPPGSNDGLLASRRSRSVFLLRMFALIAMTVAVAAFGLTDMARPVGITARSSTLPEVGDLLDKQNASGILTDDTFTISDDGVAVLRLPKGTKVADAQGKPVTAITVSARQVPLQDNIAIAGMAYEFGPVGAVLDPPASVSIDFDTDAWYPFHYFGFDVDCSQMHMAFYSDGKDVSPWLRTSGGLETRSLTAEIDHLGTLIIFCETRGMPYS